LTRIRTTVRGFWLGPFVSLVLLWAGVVIPVADRELAHDSSPALSDGASGSSTLSHDHLLCLLSQASPGWAASSPATQDTSVVPQAEGPWLPMDWRPGEARHPTHARAPPFHI